MHSCFVFFSLLLFTPIIPVFATVDNFTTDKTLYYGDDSMVISGKVDYDPTLFSIIIQIITPSGNGLAHVDSISPKPDGSFTKTIHVGGPTWSEDGKYTIKVSYGGNFEKFIDYEKTINSQPNPKSNTSQQNIIKNPAVDTDISFTENPKMRILGFPSFDKSPQYYVDRYNDEPDYQSWFDSQFPSYTIEQVVGYTTTHIENFPSFDKSPQYYVDRYNDEPDYQSWFDSQFPGKTIYDILGFSTYIPDWIKTYAKNWANGGMSDHEFMAGLDFMLQHQIIVIANLDYDSTIDEIPPWFRNTAHWWASDLISQQEFINSIKYLIQEDIILVE